MREKLGTTRSICPECLKTVHSLRVAEDDVVYLEKECPDHGKFRTVIWRGTQGYKDLQRYAREPTKPAITLRKERDNCPDGCGLCPDHVQRARLVTMEVSRPFRKHPLLVTSTEHEGRHDPDMEGIKRMFARAIEFVDRPVYVQITGGEPTDRDDLPEIIRTGKDLGVDRIDLRTDGMRFGDDMGYLRECRSAGLDSVTMSFDGVTDEVYRTMHGKEMLREKERAIDHCLTVGLPLTLHCVISPTINMDQMGDIIELARRNVPTIKGIHFQPIAYSGDYPINPRELDRLTIPDLQKAIEAQTNRMISSENFIPTSSCDVRCASVAVVTVLEDGSLLPMTHRRLGEPMDPSSAPSNIRKGVSELWHFIDNSYDEASRPKGEMTRVEFFTRVRSKSLMISVMAFQDAWNVESDRLSSCSILSVTEVGLLVPHCLYGIEDPEGRTLYRDDDGPAHYRKG